MLKAITTLILFLLSLAAIGYGVLWFVDNKEVLQKDERVVSIDSISQPSSGSTSIQDTVSGTGSDIAVDPAKDSEETIQKENDEGEVKIDANISILVLNGGAQKGDAGKMTQFLEKVGYDDVNADNAKAFNYTGITLYYQDEDMAKQVEGVLEKEYGDIDKEEATTSGQKIADVVIVIGE